MRHLVGSLCRRFAEDRSAGFAIVLALSMIPLAFAVGMAIDYAVAQRNRTELQTAADTAALAASRTAADYISNNGWSTANATAAATAGIAAAKATFAAQTASLVLSTAATITPTMTIPSAQAITANVTVAAGSATTLSGILGLKEIAIGADASAVAALPVSFYQFIFLVDISGSMAIGGTSADIAKLQSNAAFGYCGFACHDPNHYYGSTDYRALAATKGIDLKIDYVNSAIQTFLTTLNTALTKAGAGSKTSIYTYATTFNTLLSSTTNMSTAITKAATIDIEAVGKASTNWGYSKTTSALTSLKNVITNVGDGTTTTARKTYVVFISDGLQDLPAPGTTYGRSTDVDYTSACTTIKNLNSNLTLITIEATYPVVPNDDQYDLIVAPYATKMPAAMKACASSASWYFSADDGPAIQAAMNTAVVQITSTLRISN
jgi:Flp pilus assembly protein TadG